MDTATILHKADALLTAPNPLPTDKTSVESSVSERELAALHEEFSQRKHQLIDLQTKRNLAASFASSTPFAVLDTNAASIHTGFEAIKAEVKGIKRGLEEDRRAAADQAAMAVEVFGAYEASKAELQAAVSQLKELSGEDIPPAAATVIRNGVPVTLTSEHDARKLTAEEMMKTAEVKAKTVQASIEAVQLREKSMGLAKEVDAMEQHLSHLRRERASRAHAAKTQAETAGDAEVYYVTMADAIRHLLTTE